MVKFLAASFMTAAFLGIALYFLGTETEVMASAPQVGQKGDRLDIRSNEISCDWPFYHHACLQKSDGRARKVRVISPTNHRRQTFLNSFIKMVLPN